MSSQPIPIEIDCDAPPYGIVQACEAAGFRSPLDVRWRRLSDFLRQRAGCVALASRIPGLAAMGIAPTRIDACSCGQALDEPEVLEFRAGGEIIAVLFLTQCRRCHTIFWEEQPPALARRR